MSIRSLFLLLLLAAFSCTEVDENLSTSGELGRWEYFQEFNGNPIWSLFESSNGDVWIGTGVGVSRDYGSGFENYTVNDGLISSVVVSIMEDNNGDMWFGTPGGVSILTNQDFINFPNIGGLPADVSSL